MAAADRHRDRIVMITGAAKGIGAATARAFADEGATLVLADIDTASLEKTHAGLTGQGHISIRLDVTSSAEWKAAMDAVGAAFGRLDVLVNNAGWGELRSIFDTTPEQWRASLAVNLDSVFLGTMAAMPWLEKSGDAAIVNVSSIRSRVAGWGSGPYSAAKAGVEMFSRVTAVECAQSGRQVRANSIHPGFVDTPLSKAIPAAARDERIRTVPQGRLAEPEEIAAGILFLASREAAYVNGSAMVIDGAFTAV
ncbi:SDR family NAD(P)-dependent oxidoreductase [Aquibium microcysteis]|uniref:SDR family NAD(P)-dependent oxidoreductase n=1 Tax=Aquibium microcysteis TaxID=675281 RepID=UPI00165D1AA3|nr:SDR family oxidoreductase [Aquibium microcysteis]